MKTEKLELRHLVGYLPYSIKGIEATGNPIHILHTLDLNQKAVWRNQEFPAVVGRIDCKPILRPLSDLTKDIEINGEKFVPMKRISELFFDDLTIEINPITGLLQIEIETNDYSHSVDFFVGHEIVQKLYEWHFDLHSLIENDLAIDKNTL